MTIDSEEYTGAYSAIEITQQSEMETVSDQELEFPAWFRPDNMIITKHAQDRFIERIYPGITRDDATMLIQDCVHTYWWNNGMWFYKSPSTGSWIARVESFVYNLDFLIVVDYRDVNNNGIMDEEDQPVIVTILAIVPEKIRVLNQTLRDLSNAQKRLTDKVKSLEHDKKVLENQVINLRNALENQKAGKKVDYAAIEGLKTMKNPTQNYQQITALQKKLDKQIQHNSTLEKGIASSKARYKINNRKMDDDRLFFEVLSLTAYHAELARGKSASKRLLKKLRDGLLSIHPRWVEMGIPEPLAWENWYKTERRGNNDE